MVARAESRADAGISPAATEHSEKPPRMRDSRREQREPPSSSWDFFCSQERRQ